MQQYISAIIKSPGILHRVKFPLYRCRSNQTRNGKLCLLLVLFKLGVGWLEIMRKECVALESYLLISTYGSVRSVSCCGGISCCMLLTVSRSWTDKVMHLTHTQSCTIQTHRHGLIQTRHYALQSMIEDLPNWTAVNWACGIILYTIAEQVQHLGEQLTAESVMHASLSKISSRLQQLCRTESTRLHCNKNKTCRCIN